MELSRKSATREALFQAFQTTMEESNKLYSDSISKSSTWDQICTTIQSTFTKQDLKDLANKVYEAAKETLLGESYLVSFFKSPLVWIYTRIKSLQLKAIAYGMTTKNNIAGLIQSKHLLLSSNNKKELEGLELSHCTNVSKEDIRSAIIQNERDTAKKFTSLKKDLGQREEMQQKNLRDLNNIQNRMVQVRHSLLSMNTVQKKLEAKKAELQALENELKDLVPILKALRAKINSPSKEPSQNPSIDPSPIKNKILQKFKERAKNLKTKLNKEIQELISDAIPQKLSKEEKLVLEKGRELSSLKKEISKLNAYYKRLQSKERASHLLEAKKQGLVASIRENDIIISDLRAQVVEKEAFLEKVKNPKRIFTKILGKQERDDIYFFTRELQKLNQNFSVESPEKTHSMKKVESRELGHRYKEITVTNKYPIYLSGKLYGHISKTLSYGIDPKNEEDPFLFCGKQQERIRIETL